VHTEVVDGPVRQGQDRGDDGSIQSAVLRIGPPALAALDGRSQAEAPQHPDSVGLDGDPATHLGQWLGLLVDAHVDAALGQRVGRGETTDAAADDGHSKPIHAHGLLRPGLFRRCLRLRNERPWPSLSDSILHLMTSQTVVRRSSVKDPCKGATEFPRPLAAEDHVDPPLLH
jgi:hypothetical protein